MKSTKTLVTSIAFLAAMAFAPLLLACEAPTKKTPLIQFAILLDTSGSMSGLISQAKRELWRVVNEFALSKQDGLEPRLEVALYEYGNDGLPAEGGHIRQIVALSDDLDKISEELFKLTTNGGNEYCGQVIDRATAELAWSSDPEALKTIFIAGNEPFTQGPVNYKDATRKAISRGITVNTIFCGPQATGIDTMWKDGAVLADGDYLNIDQNRVVANIPAPQDRKIARLGVEINKTYVPYGKKGLASHSRQSAQDDNAVNAGNGASVQRAVSKCSNLYANSSWDLVDAVKNGQLKLEEIKKEELPEAMRKMSLEEQKTYLKGQSAERKKIQEVVTKLNVARQAFIALELKKRSNSGDDTLDSAIIKCIRRQGVAKKFSFAETVVVAPAKKPSND